MKKRILAFLLVIVLLVSSIGVTTLLTESDLFSGAGNSTAGDPSGTDSTPDAAPVDKDQRLTEEDPGAIRLSGADISATDPKEDDTSVSTATGSGALDENNALTIPYDLAFPEEFASEDCLYSGEQIMVKFRKGFTGKLNAAMKKAGITDLEKLMDTAAGPWYIASVSGDVQAVMANVRALKNVVVAEYDYLYTTADTLIDSDTVAENVQNNSRVNDQWALRSCGVQSGWTHLREQNLSGGSRNVIVAVIDTGVDYTHEDLKDNIWVNSKETPDNGIDDDGNGYIDDVYGVNLETGTGSGMDDNGHGTHVAGIIAAANNNTGIVGLAYNVKIMPIKAGMASGYFTQAQIAKGILYAYDHGADVINMSFGGSASTIAVQDALELAYTRCVLVAAAGNDGRPNELRRNAAPSYPAALSYVMGVMSVDQNGVESSFTNYDVRPYTSVEYEVYAPGSQILSTIPGNRYAVWSGTSMAAPYVSAAAALLRSAYSDTAAYPTKFIYGQIAAAGDRSAICYDPSPVSHDIHNLPKIVNIYNALTVLPKPEVSVADILVFDDPSLSGKNNGDGVIDAGETVALAFTLRNRWGAASDVTVSLDADSEAGISCPYVEFVRNNVDYGAVGTYASVDYGKTRDGEFVTGVVGDQSLLVKIADDCPNDYIVALNISLTCKNGMDTGDQAVYSSKTDTTFKVRRGTLLPSIIQQDMTLVKENYYILPNATLIQEGVTVTVEPGTQLQFWTDDPHDAYADTAITYLKVDGTLLCQGSEEEHIRMFPSELMSQYRVELKRGDKGVIDLSYTDVVNPYLDITTAENCEFSQNYRAKPLYYRYLDSGQIHTSSNYGKLSASLAESCAFYQLGGWYQSDTFYVDSKCDSCIFVDSAVTPSITSTYTISNCVFYGNNNYLTQDSGIPSSITLSSSSPLRLDPSNISRDTDTGASLVSFRLSGYAEELVQRFASYLGGEVADYGHDSSITIRIPDTTITDISLESEITIDTGMTYQLLPTVEPLASQLTETLTYTSLAPEIVAVDENGLVTPVAPGNGVIRVSNADGSVYRDVAVCIVQEIPLTGLALPEEALRLDIGTSCQLRPSVYPANTTRTGLLYESSDDTVVTVDAGGVITAVGQGSATVTVKPAMGEAFTASVTVTVVQPATALSFSDNMYVTSLSQAEDNLGLVITPETATDKTVTWDSSNPEVCYVDDTGKLVKLKAGMSTLRATLDGTELFAELPVYITENDQNIAVKKIQYASPYYYARLDNGSLWQWGRDMPVPQ